MEIRKVNVERFDAAFRAMLKNAEFNMQESCNCLQGSYSKFVLGVAKGWPELLDVPSWVSPWDTFGISMECKREWYYAFPDNAAWDSIDITDAMACIRNVMRIVEKHHGPQDWLPLFPAEPGEPRTAEMPTLDEFLKSIGIARPQVPAAE